MTHTVVVDDGDDIIIMVRTLEPSVFDPIAAYGSVVRMYRVTGMKSIKPVLELTPIMDAALTTAEDARKKIVDNELK
jgi:hypothetical protein